MAVNDTTVRTASGRTLAYADTGEPDGAPLVYFHGLPGSRLDFHQPFNRPALDGAGVRIIGIDRPGYGGSGFQPRRRYTDWPDDVATVADTLGIDRFGIVAYSGGGPYAVACAVGLPELSRRDGEDGRADDPDRSLGLARRAPRHQPSEAAGRTGTGEVLRSVRQGTVASGRRRSRRSRDA